MWNRDINKVADLVKEHDARESKIQAAVEKRRKEEEDEKTRQEQEGVITKPSQIGRFKYRMRKTDFQLEDELAGSLRTIKARATPADLMLDRFDSVFRRNMIEPDVPLGADRKRNRKAKFKWHNSKGGTGAAALDKKNKETKLKNEQKQAQGPSLLKNDLILI